MEAIFTDFKPHPAHPFRKGERKTASFTPRILPNSKNGHRANGKANSTKDPREKCCFGGKAFFDALKALLSRMLLILHAILTLWRVSIQGGVLYWLMVLPAILLFVEGLVVLLHRRGKDWKWFSPCIALYLLSVMPSIWILELSTVLPDNTQATGDTASVNGTQESENPDDSQLIPIASDQWTMLLEQSMLLLIIFSRWLMPKGDMTRDQLSGLLLGYVGIASDCVDFFAILAEDDALAQSFAFKSAVLGFYTWSMFQFLFVKTIVKEEDDDEDDDNDDDVYVDRNKVAEKKHLGLKHYWKEFVRRVLQTELWAIFVTLIMQDGPFLVVRVCVIFMYNVTSATHFFFTAKNFLLIILQIYRGVAIYQEYREQELQKKEERKTSWKRMYQKVSSIMAFSHGRTFMNSHNDELTIVETH